MIADRDLPASGRAGAVDLDISGALLSTCCAIHCATVPVVAAVLPAIGLGILAHEGVESALMGLSILIGIASLGLGYRAHRRRRIVVILAVGIGMLILGRSAEGWEAEPVGTALMIGGGLTIATSHLLGRRLRRSCVACVAEGCR